MYSLIQVDSVVLYSRELDYIYRWLCKDLSKFLNPGTRFRPLSLELPQALFPIAGVPLLEHHIDACAAVRAIILAEHSAHTCTCSCFLMLNFVIQLSSVKEILLIGFYQQSKEMARFILDMQKKHNLSIRSLRGTICISYPNIMHVPTNWYVDTWNFNVCSTDTCRSTVPLELVEVSTISGIRYWGAAPKPSLYCIQTSAALSQSLRWRSFRGSSKDLWCWAQRSVVVWRYVINLVQNRSTQVSLSLLPLPLPHFFDI